jgi:Mg2+ and Co2+ transporter CorA
MISKYKHKGLNWVDLESPTEEEVIYILDEYNIPPQIKELIILSPKENKIWLNDGFIFAHLNLTPVLLKDDRNNRLIFISNDNFIIIIHDEPIEALGEFSKEIELDTITEEKFATNNNKLLFANLLKSLYVNSHKQLIEKDAKIYHLEKLIIHDTKKFKSIIIYLVLSLVIAIIVIFICL